MKYIIASNWKANFTLQEAIDWFEKVTSYIEKLHSSNIRVIAAVPYPYIHHLSTNFTTLDVFSQNISHVEGGAYTGEVTISMLKSINFKGSIVGHSERRHIFNETNEIINKKILLLQKNSLESILCVGETLDERKQGRTKQTIQQQISEALRGVTNFELITIAYEPVWAIGTGIPIDINDLIEMEKFIREFVLREYNWQAKILYGGSVDKGFIREIIQKTTLDGALIGSASWNPFNFIDIIGNL
ncbi:MAG: triose-phosphate isomerase [bacterium]